MFFDKDGMFNLDDMVMGRPSFSKIMEDHVVTAEEIESQTQVVIALFHELEEKLNPEQQELVAKLVAESAVLQTAMYYQQIQQII